jgi:hypothetical protein
LEEIQYDAGIYRRRASCPCRAHPEQ